MNSRSRRKLTISLALAVTAAIMVTGGLSFQRKIATFQSSGVVLRDGAGDGVWVGSVDLSQHAELRTGDQIVLIGSDTPTDVADALELLRDTQATEMVVMRGTEAVTVAFERGPLAIDYSYLVLAFIGAIYLLIGLYTILQGSPESARLEPVLLLVPPASLRASTCSSPRRWSF